MVYHTIQLDVKYKDIMNIVIESGKLQDNVLPMGMLMTGYILQAEFNELLGNI